MKKMIFAKWLCLISIIFWVIETAYFGFNLKPINEAEKICDQLVAISQIIAIVFYVNPIFAMWEKEVQEKEKFNERVREIRKQNSKPFQRN
jgi:hypothetical protein